MLVDPECSRGRNASNQSAERSSRTTQSSWAARKVWLAAVSTGKGSDDSGSPWYRSTRTSKRSRPVAARMTSGTVPPAIRGFDLHQAEAVRAADHLDVEEALGPGRPTRYFVTSLLDRLSRGPQ